MDLAELARTLPQWIGQAVSTAPIWGYLAILAAMFLENIFPPIPSELIMPLGGFYVQQGQLDFAPVVLAGLSGSVLGALPWYGVGRLINERRLEAWLDRHGRWIGSNGGDLRRTRHWFDRHGTAVVLWGRVIPGIRTLISVPAGIELMPLGPFLFWTTLGSLVWTLLLTTAGLWLGKGYDRVELWIEPVTRLIKVLLVLAALGGCAWLARRLLRRGC
ncbi:MAG: DedA family protein [Aphanocapsa feldmannii 288cV]|nr:MAG: DedA family protein [Aphanocapsa feldmannii 288cV]